MNGILITARPDLQVNRRLLEAAEALGLRMRLLDGTQAVAGTEPGPALYPAPEEPPGVFLARVGNWRPASMLAVAEALEAAGWRTPNPAASIRVGRDHWRTCLALARAEIPVPRTLAGSEPETLARAAESLGFPVVVKQRRSRMGVGVIRCLERDHLEAVLDSLWRVGDEVVVQAWVPSEGVSHRLLVTGPRVAAAARFQAVGDEWRSNAARGGRASPHRPTPEEERLALRAARALGLGICGVDILPSPSGPVVVEVNPTPGFRHLEAATGVDVAAAMARELLRSRG